MNKLTETDPTGEKPYYNCVDGLRAYASIGIVLMHVLANDTYLLSLVSERIKRK